MVAITHVLTALEAAGIAAGKGGARAAGSEAVKGAWRRIFKGHMKAAEDVMAIAFVRGIEESTPESGAHSVDWWSRSGRRLIEPFVNKVVADSVMRAVVSYPVDVDATRQTFIDALELADHDFYDLADELGFDASDFLAALPEITFDELMLAAAEQDSPLLPLAQYATLRQIAANQGPSSAPVELEPLASLVEVVVGQCLPTVEELNPYQLGSTPSPFGNARTYGESDPYVLRTRDHELAAALASSERGTIVLLVGPSKAGKTRTAFEAIRKRFPEALLVAPQPGAFGRLAVDPRLHNNTDTVVVWLDDMERYVSHTDPLTPALLSQLTSRNGHTVVLATLRQEQRDRLRQGGEMLRDARVLLEQAITIELAPLTDEDVDERTGAALAYPGQSLEFGLAARLAGAPELLKRYDDAQLTDPLRHTIIQVAIDWVRVGRADPIPETTLAAMALDAFETERPDLDATDQQVAEAIKAARTAPEGSGRVAALTALRLGDQTRGYRPFDYLVAADDGQGHPVRAIPESFWDSVLASATPLDAFAIGFAAYQRGKIPVAAKASRQAADAGIATAMFNLGVLLADHQNPADLPRARRWYEKAAQAGDTNAMVNLGVLLATRWDPPDLPAAARLYERAAAAGDTDAMVNLGVLFRDLLQPPNPARASRWYLLAASQGDTNAMNNLGVLFAERNDGVTARSWYEKAAAAGHAGAMINLALLAEREEPPDLETARGWFEMAADAGNIDAMVSLGLLAEKVIPPDLLSAQAWYMKAADAGAVDAMFNMGLLAQQANPLQLETAIAWFEKAAAKGLTDAMVNLGLLAAQADPPDLRAARRWYEKAADLGNTNAMNNLGALFADLQLQPDLPSARKWYEKASQLGNTTAMVNLAMILASRWSPPEPDAAKSWLGQAAAAGYNIRDLL
ncbi:MULTISPECIES: tetratricopeptide repeat protein [unclassified Mycobacterium]|uniref:tetratricopeptide repeat protein n=1 Tax=unclassified Mycobacterium TaxID=2642494 RepID=UPI0007FC2DC3|nr:MULTISPECIES: tetratricopeptide repeat protein [unclassified Mycobacterium]OBH30531.1 hypothetical protein A5693_17750 [Mycobacterium sp. E1319]